RNRREHQCDNAYDPNPHRQGPRCRSTETRDELAPLHASLPKTGLASFMSLRAGGRYTASNAAASRFQRPVQALKSSSLTVGSFLTKATIVQISWSDTSMAPKLGMPVMLIPFLITQNNCCGARSLAISLRSGGSGFNPSENLAHLTPGPP